MKTITVAELRQNPTNALDEVEHGATYVVTRHRRAVARLVPAVAAVDLVPAERPGPSRLSERPHRELATAASVDELLDDMSSAW